MSRSHFKVMGFALEFRVHSISPEPFERSSLNFAQMLISVRRFAGLTTQLPRFKVKITLQVHHIYPKISCPLNISPEPFKQFSLNFTNMFLLVRQCAESMTQLYSLKVMVTLQDHDIYP